MCDRMQRHRTDCWYSQCGALSPNISIRSLVTTVYEILGQKSTIQINIFSASPDVFICSLVNCFWDSPSGAAVGQILRYGTTMPCGAVPGRIIRYVPKELHPQRVQRRFSCLHGAKRII